MLEHMVDTALYFEGESIPSTAFCRQSKTGSALWNAGVYEIGDNGLKDIPNASELFLSERPVGASGT